MSRRWLALCSCSNCPPQLNWYPLGMVTFELYCLLRICNEARQIAPAHIDFDVDSSLSVLTADLGRSFLIDNVGDLRKWNEVPFPVSDAQISDRIGSVALLQRKPNLQGEPPIAFDNFSYRSAANRFNRIEHIRFIKVMTRERFASSGGCEDTAVRSRAPRARLPLPRSCSPPPQSDRPSVSGQKDHLRIA